MLVGGLLDIPESRFGALYRDDGSFGWDTNTSLLADVHDVIIALIRGLGGKTYAESDGHWRPKPSTPEEQEKARAKTVADFDTEWFMQQLIS